MFVKFIKTTGEYQKGKSYEVDKRTARIVIHMGNALPDLPSSKQMKAPVNRVMTAKTDAPKKLGRPRKNKNEYDTKELHAKTDE